MSSFATTTTPAADAGRTARDAGRGVQGAPFASLLGRIKAGAQPGARKVPVEKRPAASGAGRGAPHGTSARDDEGAGRREGGATATKRRAGEEDTGEAGQQNDEALDDRALGPKRGTLDEVDPLDPLARHAAQLAPPATPGAPLDATSAAASEPVRARSLEELLPALVRRIAWAGDRHKGTVRLELGAGAYAGTTVTVHADGGRVRVELGGCEGPELDRLRARLDARLRGHGLDVESVT